jgi:hypothetical protein
MGAHAGGAKVLDGIGKELQLDEAAMEPSRMVLHDYGNVSSSTTWYTLGYVESVRGAKKGEWSLVYIAACAQPAAASCTKFGNSSEASTALGFVGLAVSGFN